MGAHVASERWTFTTSRRARTGRDVRQVCAKGAPISLCGGQPTPREISALATDVSKRHFIRLNWRIVRFERKELGRCGISVA